MRSARSTAASLSAQLPEFSVRPWANFERVKDGSNYAVVANERCKLDEPRHAVLLPQSIEKRLRHTVSVQYLPNVIHDLSFGGRKLRLIPAIVQDG